MAETTGTERDRVGTCTLDESDWDNIYVALQTEIYENEHASSMYHESTASHKKYKTRERSFRDTALRLIQNLKYETP